MQLNNLKPLDIFSQDLSGFKLIEASAGTGKTWAITGLYLRLILNKKLSLLPANILVVTFTNAATADLKDRIRLSIKDALAAYEKGETEDDFFKKVLKEYSDFEFAKDKLKRSLLGFGEAAIYTIHGFCQRLLSDQAFESGSMFESEVIPDIKTVLEEVADDFWRINIEKETLLFIEFLLANKGKLTKRGEGKYFTPDSLLKEVNSFISKPHLKIELPDLNPLFDGIEEKFCKAYDITRKIWRSGGREETRKLFSFEGLSKQKYRENTADNYIDWIDLVLCPETSYFPGDLQNEKNKRKLEKFTSDYIIGAVKNSHKNSFPLFFESLQSAQKFFLSLEEMLDSYNSLALFFEKRYKFILKHLIDYCNKELPQRTAKLNAHSYNDLLLNMQTALESDKKESLVSSIKNRFRAALIDEFQDTDPVQYEIFYKIYKNTGLPVFMVGDPKQAIYTFRGADVFTYLKARSENADKELLTLNVNRRSAAPLVQAVNTIFMNSEKPFVLDNLYYQEVASLDRLKEPFIIKGDEDLKPLFRIWFMRRNPNETQINKENALDRAVKSTACEIVRLLNFGLEKKILIGERPLLGGDIAVLVPTHKHGGKMRSELRKLGVSTVQLSQDSVFFSPEAMELERILIAISNPSREGFVRAALVTDIIGFNGNDIFNLTETKSRWDDIFESFIRYNFLWQERGFMPMFSAFLKEQSVAKRLLSFQDGERRLTNLLHLGELLQNESHNQQLGMDNCLKWLSMKRDSNGIKDESAMLRLESDEHLVKIVTIHVSKGLEYPIVFSPFAWFAPNSVNNKDDRAIYHGKDGRSTLDLGSPLLKDALTQEANEVIADRMRLFYVAITRAKYLCYIVWGNISEAQNSAPGRLFHQRQDPDRFKELSDDQMVEDIKRIAAVSSDTIKIEPIPEIKDISFNTQKSETTILSAREVNIELPNPWNIISYSSLISGQSEQTEWLLDYDRVSPGREALKTNDPIPCGPEIGVCLHTILERLEFSEEDQTKIEIIIKNTLEEYGFNKNIILNIKELILNLLNTPLDDEKKITLSKVRKNRLKELQFCYPVNKLTGKDFIELLRHHDLPALFLERMEDLPFGVLSGYMKGFIDLVFENGGRYYLVDYKSNWLGSDKEYYKKEHLLNEISSEAYFLQYIIYTAALHKYLKLRMPNYDYEQHFGNIFYLFMRGMDPLLGADYGVYKDRPKKELIEELSLYFSSKTNHNMIHQTALTR